MKTAAQWFKDFADEDAEYVTEEDIVAIQADALRHAAAECQRRKLKMMNAAHNIACDECSTYIEAEAEKLVGE